MANYEITIRTGDEDLTAEAIEHCVSQIRTRLENVVNVDIKTLSDGKNNILGYMERIDHAPTSMRHW